MPLPNLTDPRNPLIWTTLRAVALILSGALGLQSAAQQSTTLSQSDISRLYALVSLQNEVKEYVGAKYYIDLQKSLEPDKWEKVQQLILTLGPNFVVGATAQYELVNGTIKYKPIEDEADRPVWQDGDVVHLQTLLAAIRYDSKKLGLDVTTIGPTAQGTKVTLSRLITKINRERVKLVPSVNSSVSASRYSVVDNGTVKSQSTGASNTKTSDANYQSQRKELMDRAQMDNEAKSRCLTSVVSCSQSCPVSPSYACDTSCNAALDQCMKPLDKDFDETMKSVYALDAKHNNSPQPQ
jgi:hypothetical protein